MTGIHAADQILRKASDTYSMRRWDSRKFDFLYGLGTELVVKSEDRSAGKLLKKLHL